MRKRRFSPWWAFPASKRSGWRWSSPKTSGPPPKGWPASRRMVIRNGSPEPRVHGRPLRTPCQHGPTGRRTTRPRACPSSRPTGRRSRGLIVASTPPPRTSSRWRAGGHGGRTRTRPPRPAPCLTWSTLMARTLRRCWPASSGRACRTAPRSRRAAAACTTTWPRPACRPGRACSRPGRSATVSGCAASTSRRSPAMCSSRGRAPRGAIGSGDR